MSSGIISRKEEERNEKIIRGLMKLPPNRRCINCNSLGPQYVCTNFWTFVCTTCSGIHREFTHRVKSVSMSKFTSKEVEALQNGGNQRARDIYLKDWDLQRQRFPDSSNADKVRDFIKNVYLDKRYAGGKTTDKPPRDLQNLRNHEDETRRASSYHSYSQSPPYDYQYEERRYGKQGAVLTRKPGSDRGHYEAKTSSFVYSPGSLGEQTNEDSFANETSGSRASDTQSPNYQKDTGFDSPSKFKEVADGIRRPQRTTSAGSFGSFDSNSTSFKSEPEQSVGIHQDKIFTSVQSLRSNLSTAPIVSQPVTSAASTIDLLQLPSSSLVVDLFQSPSLPEPPKSSPYTSLESYLAKSSPHLSLPKDEGWATFDTHQAIASNPVNEYLKPNELSSTVTDPIVKSGSMSSSNISMQWPSFQNYNIQGASSSMTTPWHDGFQKNQPSLNTIAAQSWNAFEDSVGTHPSENSQQSNQQLATALPPSSYSNQYLNPGVPENFSREGLQRPFIGRGSTSLPSYADPGPSVAPPPVPYMSVQSPLAEMKSTNPFDVPLDSDSDISNMFLGMSSLQAALPSASLPPSFLGEVSEPWFPQNLGTPYIPATAQGGLAYLAGHTPTSQLPNVPTQGSFGGNPFA